MNEHTLFLRLQDFLIQYKNLWSTEPLFYYPNNYDENITKIINIVRNLNSEELLKLENTWEHPFLKDFLSLRNELTQIENYFEEFEITNLNKVGMTSKKRHEISRLHSYLNPIIKRNNNQVFFDIGAGVGHLVFSLYDQHPDRQFFILDQDPVLIKKGSDKALRKLKEKRSQIQFKETSITKNNYPKSELMKGVLHGLHSCGELSNDIIDWFLISNHTQLILTSCCYHKLQHWNFSKDAKLILTPHALHLAAKGDNFQDEKSYKKKYLIKEKRYMLSLFHFNKEGKHLHSVGSLPKLSYQGDIIDYAKKVYPKIFDEGELREFSENKYNLELVSLLIKIGAIRGAFSKPLELYIILDRLLYLKEKGIKAKLISLFDRKYSPRNLTLVAEK